MKAVLPGRPEAQLQALSSGAWNGRRVTAYISGSAIAVLGQDDQILQTIYDSDNEKLVAVAFDEASGKISTASSCQVKIYKGSDFDNGPLQWSFQSTLESKAQSEAEAEAGPSILSWGRSEELLIANRRLCLYDTRRSPTCLWRKHLSSVAHLASLSYDSAYAATAAYRDALVKVWRRLSYGSDDVRFDFSYLRHPHAVTGIEWRKPHHVEQTVENVLFTFCADNTLRVWTGSDIHGGQNLQLWGLVDLAASIQDHALNGVKPTHIRLAFIIQGRDFACAVENAVETSGSSGVDDTTMNHVVAIANKNPEICVVLDGKGNISAWALENVSCKSQKANTFNIARVRSTSFEFPGLFASSVDSHVEVYNYCNRSHGQLRILMHFFNGQIEVFECNISLLLDPGLRSQRLKPLCVWSGHSAPIRKIVRNFSGKAILSRTRDGECMVWNHFLSPRNRYDPKLPGPTMVPASGRIERICVLRKGRFVIFLRKQSISLWDCRQTPSKLLATCDYLVPGQPLCLLILPRQSAADYLTAHIATVTSEQRGIVWEVLLPDYAKATFGPPLTTEQEGTIRELCRFHLEDAGDLAYVLPVDPAGSSPIIAGFLDVFARDVAISYTHSGRVEFWTARVDVAQRRVGWLSTSLMETGVSEPALVSGSTMKKAALVNAARSELTIWDIRGARLEYAQDFEQNDTIRDLDWTSTPDSQSILAVGFQSKVLVLCQMRFDYLNKKPAWATIRQLDISNLTPHSIGDSTWLGDGNLVIGAGNQLFLYGRSFRVSSSLVSSLRLPYRKDGMWDLFEVAQRLNGPLPVYHPQFLSQCMMAGKNAMAHRILLALHHTLKYFVQGDVIDDYLGLDVLSLLVEGLSSTTKTSYSHSSDLYFSRRASKDDSVESFTEDTGQSINEKLTTIALPHLSGHEQIQLVDIVECAGLVEKHRRSMDENGSRYMLFFRQHALRKGRTSEIQMSWREINWAYHSTNQDILVDFVSKQYHGTMLWENAKESGMFMWLGDNSAVKAQFEVIARNEYTKGENKNPVDCSLFYLALKKKAVLQGLWRMASWNREQAATQRLLANDFTDPKWKTAALKNAYALLSKRRFEYAAAFFLLADHLQDAVNVCLTQLKDLQLAIAISRVYGGDHGPVFLKLLEEDVLSIAAQEGNRWLASWAFWMLHRRDMAVRALITPVFALLETPLSPGIKSKLFLTDDPALIVLYAQLRQKTLQTLRGASKVTPRIEWEFVLHNARLYSRMGCDLLGLDLVRNWEFLQPASRFTPGLGGEIDPAKLAGRRSSLVVADLPMPRFPLEARAGHQASQPTLFEEPDASSLLDNFGF